MNKIIITAVAGLALAACSGNHETDTKSGTIDIASALANQTEVTTSQLGGKISFIPLETSDSCLVGNQWTLKVAGDKIVITNVGQMVFNNGDNTGVQVFDLNTGKYISSPGRVGQGPEDRENGFVYTNKNGNRLYSKAGNGNGYVVYTTDGKFAGKMPAGPRLSSFLTDADTTITFLKNDTDDSSRELVLYTYGQSGALLDSCVIFAGQEEVPFKRIFTGGEMVMITAHDKSGFPLTKMSMTEFKVGGKSSIIPGIPLNQIGDELYITQTMCDTIYRLGADGAEPVITFDFGGKGFPYTEFNNRLPNSNEIFVVNSLMTPSKVLFALSEGWLGEETHKEYVGVYDRKTGSVKLGDKEKGIADDLGAFMPFNPVTTTADGKFIGVLTMEEIEDWLAEHPDAERPAALANSTAEDNPVLVVISD